ncbi:Uncharacterised protein [Mycobacteroides abscessus subsp. abscessus]|nr:Uncharacterised protein [Mycobacteroides abscessus subsp. abscessus]SHU22603.1 Uncharacterised protein [Mycobacteroides abscessus subsp. abscessus]SHZ62607.1 Uncharacterised protein [Mycobacteroides abscessus subsp. abscessus]SKT24190.1 Uncharacterised protein [Mycobacteroides abscessus subsp. abscessus]SKZ53881.1 Uncharacterised protein [Mycobacteroides abscessus subsp. abscessus]
MFSVMDTDCMLTWNGTELWSIGAPMGRVMLCTLLMPSTRKTFFAMRSSTSMFAGVRRSLSASTIRMSGFILAFEKCRSEAWNPWIEGRLAGM